MIRKSPYIVVALAVLALSAAHAIAGEAGADPRTSVVEDGQVKIRLTADKSEASVADPIELKVEVEAPAKTRVVLPQTEAKLGEFDVRSNAAFNDIPSGDASGNRLYVLRLKLDTIKTGDLVVPPIEIQYSQEGSSTGPKSLSTKPLPIRITSVLEERADPTKFRDIKSTVDVVVPSPTSYAWVSWTAGSAVALAGTLLVVTALQRRRRPAPAAWALASIDDVAKLKIESPADAQAVVNEIVDIIREYFGLTFDVPALSRTSRELVSQAKRRFHLNDSAIESLTWLASLADEIKFAQLGTGEKQAREAIDRARTFVNKCEQQRLAQEKGAA